MAKRLFKWIAIVAPAATCLIVGVGLGFLGTVLYVQKAIAQDRAMIMLEYAEWVRTGDKNRVVTAIEDDAYMEISNLLRFVSQNDVESINKYELKVLQKLKSYRDRYRVVDSENTVCPQKREKVNRFLECVPWAEEDQTRRTFLAKYKSGEPQLAPSLTEVTWFTEEGTSPQLFGKVVLVDFWGLRCQPCLHAFPLVQELYEKFGDDGLEVVAVHTQRSNEKKIKELFLENQYTFLAGQGHRHLYQEYWVRVLPSYYLIDRRGRLVWGPEHNLPDSTLLEKLLNE